MQTLSAVLLLVIGFASAFTTCRIFQNSEIRTRTSSSIRLPVATVEEPITADTNTSGFTNDDRDVDNAFNVIVEHATNCLVQSDMRRNAVGQPQGTQASSTTNWINDASAFVLQKAVDKIALKLAGERAGVDRDEASAWIRWMKTTPTPLLVDLSSDLQKLANETLADGTLELINTPRKDFLDRMGCRLILLPSGASLNNPFSEPPASIIYGKLLYGGVTRYRLLESSNSNRPARRVGERTESKTSKEDNVPVWMMYGGRDRNYDAVDMGPAAVFELYLLPRGQHLPHPNNSNVWDMTLSRIQWNPQRIFHFIDENNAAPTIRRTGDLNALSSLSSALSGKSRNDAFKSDFQSCVGGLQSQIDAIVRRVLDGRVIRPADVVDAEQSGEINDETSVALAMASADAEELALLGLTPVRGLLLYGPPGCGKTILAREIARALRARKPKIVSAPELLDRWVGGSERLIRELFSEAEAELAACNGLAEKSALHVVVIDEIDAVFRKRSSGEDSGEVTRASAVNQILAKLDGVNSIPNVLLIGMTNRRELLDEALLRPGRLEVQIEIPLPQKESRREILRIHFEALRERGRLSLPLCCAIENDAVGENDSGNGVKLSGTKTTIKSAMRRFIPNAVRPKYDLAGSPTAGFSGADIAGMVRCAGSIALSRARQDGNGVEGLLITLEDVKQAITEVRSK
mmetsp:Transcript_12683/g.18641  ORF Transcript_12683/g.18641 Transcript_12683/m.18641 type:complete len:690 (-) Transcript_12683:30-2099(-)|eukprot:CAMPEP_0194257852 /NCGR_PEP_ID=MMETSP0158-20130606/40019_1 /TAXON_ID=33649 /ORGANISM="Thalassionema nitzschioides, Strain L26-B" /LENGTH=689 /DNA_ID=CAMNT_0038997035 /DNA_START=134 /DNA_END=2203 /DNA_ORIENTATION=-